MKLAVLTVLLGLAQASERSMHEDLQMRPSSYDKFRDASNDFIFPIEGQAAGQAAGVTKATERPMHEQIQGQGTFGNYGLHYGPMPLDGLGCGLLYKQQIDHEDNPSTIYTHDGPCHGIQTSGSSSENLSCSQRRVVFEDLRVMVALRRVTPLGSARLT
eukprot:GHVU01187489.1.p1 GENE.GHVU01187489.1~~GHVU01187489.1.p1  ORF type:complete len:159 (+),score=12.16 GHVU01187489.1:129-605(+)